MYVAFGFSQFSIVTLLLLSPTGIYGEVNQLGVPVDPRLTPYSPHGNAEVVPKDPVSVKLN